MWPIEILATSNMAASAMLLAVSFPSAPLWDSSSSTTCTDVKTTVKNRNVLQWLQDLFLPLSYQLNVRQGGSWLFDLIYTWHENAICTQTRYLVKTKCTVIQGVTPRVHIAAWVCKSTGSPIIPMIKSIISDVLAKISPPAAYFCPEYASICWNTLYQWYQTELWIRKLP